MSAPDSGQVRQPKGTPVDGQYSAAVHGEADVTLPIGDPDGADRVAETKARLETGRDTSPKARVARIERNALDSVPEPLREDYHRIGGEIAALDREIAALSKKRGTLHKEREAILEMAAQHATSDLSIAALRHGSTAGYQRFRDAVRAIHPNFYEGVNYLPTTDERRTPTPTPTPPYLGLHISLMESGARPLDGVDTTELATAMEAYADRFVDEVPETGDFPGMIFTDVLTSGDDRFHIFYAPDGSSAALVDDGHRWYPEKTRTGPLPEILDAAIARCERQAREPDDEY